MLEGGLGALDTRTPVVVVGPPLRGERYIAADSCCDATRHTRAALPVNGRVWLAQRFAVDWEQMNAENRIYTGQQTSVASYVIYGKEAIAVADATVVSVIDGMPSQVPRHHAGCDFIDRADGNSVVLDLGGGRYALYAHLQAGSLRVHPGDKVKRGQTLGLVGNSGNSLAPHLHFHVMDGPSPMASNGVPYEIDSFQITGTTAGTAAFDEAEAKGTPLAIMPLTPPLAGRNSLPLDQLVISFPVEKRRTATLRDSVLDLAALALVLADNPSAAIQALRFPAAVARVRHGCATRTVMRHQASAS